jgi:L-ascorbate metabolism protein UlaG (beta-lactamase superfamily)
LVFDYVEALPQVDPLPAGVALEAKDLDKPSLVVFVTHGHADHYSRTVAQWSKERPDIQYVLGWPDADLPGARVMKPRQEWSSGALSVKKTGSTDEGVGFLVSVDGLTLYHGGDHAQWTDQAAQPFEAEILWLSATPRPTIDIAFLPIATGFACDPRPSIWQGVRFAALKLSPRVLIPMHVRCPDKLDLYERFRAEVAAELGSTIVVAPRHRGERFRYASGNIDRVE